MRYDHAVKWIASPRLKRRGVGDIGKRMFADLQSDLLTKLLHDVLWHSPASPDFMQITKFDNNHRGDQCIAADDRFPRGQTDSMQLILAKPQRDIRIQISNQMSAQSSSHAASISAASFL